MSSHCSGSLRWNRYYSKEGDSAIVCTVLIAREAPMRKFQGNLAASAVRRHLMLLGTLFPLEFLFQLGAT